MIVLNAINLKKTYTVKLPVFQRLLAPFAGRQQLTALDNVTISIDSNQILGLAGQNGAGKTTLIKILADILEPDQGTVSICCCKLSSKKPQLRSMIGYVSSDDRSFFWRLTGRENLQFFAKLYGLAPSQAKKTIQKLITQFDFQKKADQPFSVYSAGMRKKLAVIRALLHQPSLLLLDEVTNSLDADSALMVKQVIRHYVNAKQNRAALWSTHRFEEISQICDKLVTIRSGRIISDLSLQNSSRKHSLQEHELHAALH